MKLEEARIIAEKYLKLLKLKLGEKRQNFCGVIKSLCGISEYEKGVRSPLP